MCVQGEDLSRFLIHAAILYSTFYFMSSFYQLLWLACRHHMLELILKATFFRFFGDTSGPEVTLFKFLKTSWDSLNLAVIFWEALKSINLISPVCGCIRMFSGR